MKERLSALIDGALDDASCDDCLKRLGSDADLRRDWSVYHLIGDALRGTAASALPTEFESRLAAEPTVLAPTAARARAAGRGSWHYALAAAAGVAAVALVGWVALPQLQPAGDASVAAAPQPAAPAVAAAAPAREQPLARAAVPVATNMDDYLIAHQRFSPSSAMSGVAPYVRTVSDPRRPR